ncbi:hypothetical protein [Streptomyces boluensis]|nr:hypothetical protein [Streptomyces boluensis]
MPAGKAIAIAAMPTSILMGMGLTPTLAHAKPQPDNPFRDGPCVTAPDKDAEAEEKAEKEQAAKEKAAKEKAAEEKAAEEKKDAEEAAEKPSAGDDSDATPATGDSGDTADEPEPEPSPTETENPLDPLGVGDKIKDVFTPDDQESESPAPEPSASDDTKSDATDPVKDTVDGVEDAADKVTDGAKDAAEKAEEAAEKAKEDADRLNPSADPLAPDADGKKPFPCVVEKKVDGDSETPPAPIPEDPWHLEASSLLLKGADYQGVVNLKTPSGKTKQVLKYVISKGTDIGDLHQTVEGPGGETYHIRSAKGATSTIRNGETIMYTEKISGHLFGLIPITFDPEHPPPLNIPTIYFTNVEVVQAGQFGGTLTVPGFNQEITP